MMNAIRKHYLRDLINRMNDLETAVHVFANSPSYVPGDGVGLNGSTTRKKIFDELRKKYDFSGIIETGTYLGDTSGYLAETSGLPVYSSEINRILHSLAKMRLKDMKNVCLIHSDSRKFIEEISRDPEIVRKECFFYLDAHWGKDCPLVEEISLIASCWEKFVMMIDDFQVPGDDGYGYDRYGAFKKLNISLIRRSMKKHDLGAYFPAVSSEEEGVLSKPRGFVILMRNDEYANPIKTISLLKEHRF